MATSGAALSVGALGYLLMASAFPPHPPHPPPDAPPAYAAAASCVRSFWSSAIENWFPDSLLFAAAALASELFWVGLLRKHELHSRNWRSQEMDSDS